MGGDPTGVANNVAPIPSEAERLKWARKEAESIMAWEIWDALQRGEAVPWPRFVAWAQQASWEKWDGASTVELRVPDTKVQTDGHAPECECPKCEPGKWK